MDEMKKYHEHGTHVPQIEARVAELKAFIRDIMDNDEVDPRNEWTIKAHQLLAWGVEGDEEVKQCPARRSRFIFISTL